MSLYKVKVGDTQIAAGVNNVIFDTGSSLCYVDQRTYNYFIAAVKKVASCSMDSR